MKIVKQWKNSAIVIMILPLALLACFNLGSARRNMFGTFPLILILLIQVHQHLLENCQTIEKQCFP